MDKSQDKKWHAIYTKARCEKKVLDQLRLRKIEAYLPLRTEVHQWSDRKKKVDIPIISSYVFVRISPDERKNIYPISGFVNSPIGMRLPSSASAKWKPCGAWSRATWSSRSSRTF